MSNQKIIFSQIISLIPWYQFDKIVLKHKGDYKTQNFKCRDHLLVMIFAQLTYREGLRAIEYSLNSQRTKLYHMGFKCNNIARNTIANANEIRDYRIYEELANLLTIRAKELYVNDKILDNLNSINQSTPLILVSSTSVSPSLPGQNTWRKKKLEQSNCIV